MTPRRSMSRRQFHLASVATAIGGVAGEKVLGQAPAVVASDARRPLIANGVSSGDVTSTAAVIWSRTNRPARMIVEISATEEFKKFKRVVGPEALDHRDFTAKIDLLGLAPGEDHFYRVRFQDLEDSRVFSDYSVGHLRTAPEKNLNIRFVWSADTCGQGFGIDLARGGLRMYRTMREMKPDFLVHSGDTIYADNPIPESITLDDGAQWKNVVTPETLKVAETLDEFRARFRYNTLDEHFRAFHAHVPVMAQWDDHETLNNWYPGELLTADPRYTVKSVDLLAARARTAFFEYLPIRERASAPGRIYRKISYGPQLDLFFIDMRSHRGPNASNREGGEGDPSLFGKPQLQWLKRSLKASTATWKIICSDMPIGLIVGDGPGAFEAVANGDGPPAGRELEIAELLTFLRDQKIHNTAWLCGDVHYGASVHYSPDRAVFKEFEPFWEFVSGPIHAGTFGPNKLDNTFGPEVRFQSIPNDLKANRPPSDGLQFFGMVELDGESGKLKVSHYNVVGERIWSIDLNPHQ
jgi:alkaline phosphatase D